MSATVAKFDMGLLRRLANGDPDRLPLIVSTPGWDFPPRVAGRRVFMSEADVAWLKSRLPLELVAYMPGVQVVFRIALQPHHLAGGRGDARPADTEAEMRSLIRADFGFDKDQSPS